MSHVAWTDVCWRKVVASRVSNVSDLFFFDRGSSHALLVCLCMVCVICTCLCLCCLRSRAGGDAHGVVDGVGSHVCFCVVSHGLCWLCMLVFVSHRFACARAHVCFCGLCAFVLAGMLVFVSVHGKPFLEMIAFIVFGVCSLGVNFVGFVGPAGLLLLHPGEGAGGVQGGAGVGAGECRGVVQGGAGGEGGLQGGAGCAFSLNLCFFRHNFAICKRKSLKSVFLQQQNRFRKQNSLFLLPPSRGNIFRHFAIQHVPVTSPRRLRDVSVTQDRVSPTCFFQKSVCALICVIVQLFVVFQWFSVKHLHFVSFSRSVEFCVKVLGLS